MSNAFIVSNVFYATFAVPRLKLRRRKRHPLEKIANILNASRIIWTKLNKEVNADLIARGCTNATDPALHHRGRTVGLNTKNCS